MPDTPRVTVYLCDPGAGQHLQLQWISPLTGRRVTRTSGTHDEKEARKLAAVLEERLNRGEAAPAKRRAVRASVSGIGWDELIAEFDRLHLSALTRTARWNMLGTLRHLAAVCPAPARCDARAVAELSSALRKAGAAQATVASHLARVRTALRWAAAQGHVAACPQFVVPAQPRRAAWRTTDDAGYRRLLDACPSPAWRLFTALAWHAGLRRGELLRLTWDGGRADLRLDLERRRLLLPLEANKAGRDDWLPLHPELLAVLGEVPAARRRGRVVRLGVSSPKTVTEHWDRIATRAGLEGLKPHDLRRSFGTRFARSVPAPVLQRLMRHASIQTTLGYYADLSAGLEEMITAADPRPETQGSTQERPRNAGRKTGRK